MSSQSPTVADATTSAKRTDTSLQKGNALTSIETRTDLSILYRLLRACIRPLRPRLVGIKPLNQSGSPRLTTRPSSHYGITISERMIQIPSTPEYPLTQLDPATNTQKLWLYDMIPGSLPKPKTKTTSDTDANPWWTHTIYYFAGGGFQAPASSEHWKLTARLAKDLSPHHIRIVMVSYPLAPKSPAKHSLPLLRAWLAQTLTETTSPSETISLMGDSAGGNVVLSLAFWWATLLTRMTEQTQVKQWKKLVEVMTVSPPCDFRNTNPAIEEADKIDPVLDRETTGGAADAWCAGWTESSLTTVPSLPLASSSEPLNPKTATSNPDGGSKSTGKSDPALSPNLQPPEAFTALRDSGLVVHGAIGTADRLAPDALVFMGLCVEREVKGEWLVWEGQMHCFVLTVCYGVSEGREGYEWVRRRVEGLGR
ncbi:hypothetical protein ES702_03609 [subsurface metagenome]